MPTISVIIPNYNRESLIGETLECLLNQTRPPDEIIVVDDGSTDGSVQVLKSFGDRITLITQPNSGPAVARNRGLAASSGDFIQFFDSDDLCSLNKLEVQARALEQTDADFAYGPWLQTRLSDGVAISSGEVLQPEPLPARRSALSWFLTEWVIVFQCCMFRRALLDRVGPYRTDLMPTEDSELLFRILKSGAKGVHTPDCLVAYRLHDGGQISQGGMQNAKRVRDWRRYVEGVASQLDGPGAPVSWYSRLSWDCARLDAYRQVMALPEGERGDLTTAPFSIPKRLIVGGLSTLRRIGRSLDRRRRKTNFAPAFRSGRLTSSQAAQLSALGYAAATAADVAKSA